MPFTLKSSSSIFVKTQTAFFHFALLALRFILININHSRLTVNFRSKLFLKHSIHKVVGDLNTFFEKFVKDLNNHVTDIREHQTQKGKEQE